MKPKAFFLVLLHTTSFLLVLTAQTQDLTIDRGIMGLSQALDRLPFTSRVLFMAAHPDDENSGVLPYVSRGLHAKTALLTLTRGEGGQNLIGPDLFDALGLIRTGEMLAAGEYYGVQQFFTRAFDFGFSKSPEETLQKWSKEAVLSDMVRAIRQFRPHVIISVWRGSASDGHGHHQASGLLAREAFHAAGDPARFPELAQDGLPFWKVQKLYVRSQDRQNRNDLKKPAVAVDPGQHVPLLGASFQEIASLGYSLHRSQGQGSTYSPPGARVFSYQLVSPEDPTDSGFLDKLAVRLSDLPQLLPTGDTRRLSLQRETEFLEAAIVRARKQLLPSDFSGTVEPLLAGLTKLREIRESVAEKSPPTDTQETLLFFLKEKEDDFCKALEMATGIYFEALSSDPEVVPGQTFETTATVVNRSAETLELEQAELTSAENWKSELREGTLKPLPSHAKVSLKYQVTVPAQASFSKPHWSRRSTHENMYTIEKGNLINVPLMPPRLRARLDYRVRGTRLRLERAVEFLDSDKFKGTRKIPLMVVPTIAIEVSPPQQLVSTSAPRPRREVQVKLVNNSPGQIAGTLLLNGPPGWNADPKQVPFTIGRKREAATYHFLIQAANGVPPGRAAVEAVASVNGKQIAESYRLYTVLDLWRFPLYRKAASEVVAFDYKLPRKVNVGYIMGAGDRVPETLLQLGIPVRLLGAEELASGYLQLYDCIVAGVRAYEVRDDLVAHNPRLLEYVKNGGVFIVQYHRQAPWNRAQYAPYPATIENEAHRVTDETATVRILDPKHPVFHYPNQITPKDFEDWVQERGLYFLQKRDPRYKPLLSCNDPGQPPLDGGLLVADYGQGKYVLTSYAWFRQLPEGVPGAIRIFINLISLKEKASGQGG
jgi:LmbE family N-acetylglucosaminyl deacetylase